MHMTQNQSLLSALLDSWDRSNAIGLNLLAALPGGALHAKAMSSSPSVAEMFTHIHHERMVSVFEEAPKFAGEVPSQEWVIEPDPRRIAQMLNESAKIVRDAVKNKIESGEDMDLNFDHPVLLLQLLIFHEAYHHGQIKLALKLAGLAIPDAVAGPLTWEIWRGKQSAVG